MLKMPRDLQGDPSHRDLGWIDSNLGSSPASGPLHIPALARWWNAPNLIQPFQCLGLVGHPVVILTLHAAGTTDLY